MISTYLYNSLADVSSPCVRNFTRVGSSSFFPVTVEDLQNTSVLCGLHVVLVRRPDEFSILSPGDAHSLAASERTLETQRLSQSEIGVLELCEETGRL